MVKVKVFGVIRSTTGVSYLEVNADSVQGIFDELSAIMKKGYNKDSEKQSSDINEALKPHKVLKFGYAIVYVNGERCKQKSQKLSDGDEVWLLSPAAGG